MSKDKTSFDEDEDKAIPPLVIKYEAMKRAGRNFYMEPDQIIDIAEWYGITGKPEAAYDVLVFGLQLHPEHNDILISLAYVYIDKEQTEEAEKIIRLIDDEQPSPELIMLKAEVLMANDKLSETETLLNTLADAENPDLYIDIAGLFIDFEQYAQGLTWLLKAVPFLPDNEGVLWAIAECCYSTGKYEEAACRFNELLDAQPYHSGYWTGLAKVRFLQQQYEKTLEACDFALVCDGTAGDAHLFKAHALFQLEHYVDAIAEYEKALEHGETCTEYIYTCIGNCHTEQKEWLTACLYYEKALLENNETDISKQIEAYMGLAGCRHKLGRYDEAHEACVMMQLLYPEYLDSYLIEGRIYYDEGNREEAEWSWNFVMEQRPNDILVLVRIGEFCLESGDLQKAKTVLEKARTMEPNNITVNVLLILTCIRLKDWQRLLEIHAYFNMPAGDQFRAFVHSYCEGNNDPIYREITEAIEEFKEEETKNVSTGGKTTDHNLK